MQNTAEQFFDAPPGALFDLPLDLIDFDPDQPRKDFDEAFIAELADDIAAHGVLQPITVRPNPEAPGRYVVVFGENRTRASRAAGLATIPAVLREDDQTEDPLARMLAQVKENHLRRDLNPMEWAEVLRRMREQHGKRNLAEVEEALAGHGIKMSRPQISNLMRLAELPDWAQDLVRRGEITAAHGKHLLTAKASEAVLAELEEEYRSDDYRPSVRELHEDIYSLFMRCHVRLDGYYIRFNHEQECDGCRKRVKISNECASGLPFCLDAECHERKNEAARKARLDESQAELEKARSGHDHDEPAGQPVIVPGRRSRNPFANEHADIARWLRTDALPGYVSLHPGVQLMLLVLAVTDDDIVWESQDAVLRALEEAGVRVTDEDDVYDVNAVMAIRFDGELQATVALAVLTVLRPEHLAHLALSAEIDIDDWRPDATWLAQFSKAELVDLLIEMGVYDEDDRPRLGKLNTDELVERIVEDGDRLDPPERLREAWDTFIALENG